LPEFHESPAAIGHPRWTTVESGHQSIDPALRSQKYSATATMDYNSAAALKPSHAGR
jgi:hypothetical protein